MLYCLLYLTLVLIVISAFVPLFMEVLTKRFLCLFFLHISIVAITLFVGPDFYSVFYNENTWAYNVTIILFSFFALLDLGCFFVLENRI